MTVLAVVGVIVAGVLFMGAESKPSYQPLFTNLQSVGRGRHHAAVGQPEGPVPAGGRRARPSSCPRPMSTRNGSPWPSRACPRPATSGSPTSRRAASRRRSSSSRWSTSRRSRASSSRPSPPFRACSRRRSTSWSPSRATSPSGTQQTTTASILVDLAPGTALSSGQVSAIVHLAASSIPGLSSSDVTVVDNHGDVLTAPGDAGGTSGASDTQQTDAYDNQLAASLTALLARVVGEGNAAVQVNALLNFNQSQTTTNGLQTERAGPAGHRPDRADHVEQQLHAGRGRRLRACSVRARRRPRRAGTARTRPPAPRSPTPWAR